MDFWAQHKEFVLKVLAGLGVFLVALIARGIVYGDDLEKELATNSRAKRQVEGMKLIPLAQIAQLESNATKLAANTREFASRMGWDAGADDIDVTLIERILSRLRRLKGASAAAITAEARAAREAIRADLNGGFGQLRLAVEEELKDEASERNIHLDAGVGFGSVLNIEPADLMLHLVQLEFTTRMVRYALDSGAEAVEEIKIETKEGEAIPGGSPGFLREYAVFVRLRASQAAMSEVLNRLKTEPPSVPVRDLRIVRQDRPLDHLVIELTGLVTVTHPEALLALKKKE